MNIRDDRGKRSIEGKLGQEKQCSICRGSGGASGIPVTSNSSFPLLLLSQRDPHSLERTATASWQMLMLSHSPNTNFTRMDVALGATPILLDASSCV